jgi:hypothetical protein
MQVQPDSRLSHKSDPFREFRLAKALEYLGNVMRNLLYFGGALTEILAPELDRMHQPDRFETSGPPGNLKPCVANRLGARRMVQNVPIM